MPHSVNFTGVTTDPADPGGPDEEDDEEDTADQTTFERMTGTADPERFDQTFLAKQGDFNIGGDVTSPAPYPLQVIPRVAYTINFNMVWDDDRERWEPQTPFSGGPTVDNFVVTTVNSVGFTQLDEINTFHIINNQAGGGIQIELPPREAGAVVVVKNSTDSNDIIGVQDDAGDSTGIDNTTQSTNDFDADGSAARFYADVDRSTWWVEAFASVTVS